MSREVGLTTNSRSGPNGRPFRRDEGRECRRRCGYRGPSMLRAHRRPCAERTRVHRGRRRGCHPRRGSRRGARASTGRRRDPPRWLPRHPGGPAPDLPEATEPKTRRRPTTRARSSWNQHHPPSSFTTRTVGHAALPRSRATTDRVPLAWPTGAGGLPSAATEVAATSATSAQAVIRTEALREVVASGRRDRGELTRLRPLFLAAAAHFLPWRGSRPLR